MKKSLLKGDPKKILTSRVAPGVTRGPRRTVRTDFQYTALPSPSV